MIGKAALHTTSASSKRQAAELIEDIAVETIITLFPVVVIVSISLGGTLCGWTWGAVVGAGLWALLGAIIAVSASFISNRADEGFL